MPKYKKEPSRFFCPECKSDDVLTYEEVAYKINTSDYYCTNVKHHDCDAEENCQNCEWTGFKRELIDKTEEVEAAEKLKADKKYQRYLKLKAEYEPNEAAKGAV